MLKLNKKLIRSFITIAKPFFYSEIKWKARGLLFLLVSFSVVVSLVNVQLSYIGRDFMTAFSLKDKSGFFYQLYLYLIAFAVATPIVVFYRYTEERLGLLWRKWLSLKLLNLYLDKKAYYTINNLNLIDNPDQRIVEDVRSFTTLSLSFLLIILNAIIALFAFMGILWSISVQLTIAAIVYAFIGSLLTFLLGRPLVGLNFEQLKRDADYRYKLINIRDNAESIAFYNGEKKEFTRSRQKLKRSLENFKLIVNWNRNLNFFTTGYNYLITILPTIIVAPLYLDGKIEFGVVTQAGFAFSQVLGALSIIVLNFGGLSTFGAVISRLGTFWEVIIEQTDHNPYHVQEMHSRQDALLPQGSIQYSTDTTLTFNNVSIYTPTSKEIIVKDLTFRLEMNRGILITGGSGSGKSSTLRAIAGLWKYGTGTITRPESASMMFIPQRPYMVMGSLRSQLLYSQQKMSFTDEELKKALQEVNLLPMFHRVGGFDAILDWPSILSTGEQQRLALARSLLSEPQFIFLDEATTAIDPRFEEVLYCKVLSKVKGYVSVGHRNKLDQFHHTVITLNGDSTWSIEDNPDALTVCGVPQH
jgi:vitamin B12/bleomycin/antimicrobial peptide transport system ATP-binding/permease protein